MESRAFAEFGNGVWALFAALSEITAPVLASHWILAVIILVATLYLTANIWMIGKMYGSIGAACKEDGCKKCLFILFFGVPWAFGAFIKLLSPEEGEEDEA
jgi:hypothetical protein